MRQRRIKGASTWTRSFLGTGRSGTGVVGFSLATLNSLLGSHSGDRRGQTHITEQNANPCMRVRVCAFCPINSIELHHVKFGLQSPPHHPFDGTSSLYPITPSLLISTHFPAPRTTSHTPLTLIII
jgi:hypothetical protein